MWWFLRFLFYLHFSHLNNCLEEIFIEKLSGAMLAGAESWWLPLGGHGSLKLCIIVAVGFVFASAESEVLNSPCKATRLTQSRAQTWEMISPRFILGLGWEAGGAEDLVGVRRLSRGLQLSPFLSQRAAGPCSTWGWRFPQLQLGCRMCFWI